MVTESRKAILAFEVTGQSELLGALQTLGTVESRLQALARNAATVTSGGLDSRASSALYRGLFKDNEQATRQFDQALQQTKTNTRGSITSMVSDFALLEQKIAQLKALNDRVFKSGDFGPLGRTTYTAAGLPGAVHQTGPGQFYPVSESGQRLSETPTSSRTVAAGQLQADAIRTLEREITDVLARSLGRDAGFQDLERNTRLTPQQGTELQAHAQRLLSVMDGMEAAGRRVTRVWDENGRTMVAWERDVNGRVQQGAASLDLVQRYLATGVAGAGGRPPGPPAPPVTPGAPEPIDPAQRADLNRGVTAFLRSTIDEAGRVITDLAAGSNLGQRYKDEEPGPAAQAAVGAKQIDAETADLKNQAKLEAQRMFTAVNDLVRTTGVTYQDAAQQVRAQNEARLRQTTPQYQDAVIRSFDRLASSANTLSRSMDTGSRAVLKEAQLRETESRTGISKYGAQFQQGFYGRRELPFAEQIGQVAKFSLLYGAAYQALFAFQQGLQAAVTQAIDFNSALIELSIATGRTTGESTEFAERLGRIATGYGLTPGEGIRTGAAAVGIFGLQDSANMEGEVAAFTEAVGQVAFVTGRTAEQVTQDVGAISQAFNLSAGSSRISQDLDAYFSKRFGSPAGGTLETVAQIGSLGSEAGFSQEEVTALASVLQSRTGQTPAATAGFLSQFFGRAGDPALKQTFAELGIDVANPFRDQVNELSKIMQSGELGEDLRLQIINAFGRGRSGQAAAIITESFPEVREAAKDAETDAAGAGQQQFEERLESVGGQLRVLQGTLIELAVNIGQSGLLDAIAAIVLVIQELAEAANTVLTVFNLLPRGVRDALIALGLFTLALRTNAGKSLIGGLLEGAGQYGALNKLGYAPLTYDIATRSPNIVPPTGTLGAAGGLASARGLGSAALAGSVALLTNPITLAIGGLLAVASLNEQATNLRVAMADATGAMSQFGQANTAEELDAAAKGLRAQADSVEESPGLLINAVSFGYAQEQADLMGERLRSLADEAEEAAKQEARFVNLQAANTQQGVFANPAIVDDLITGVQALEAANVGPIQRLRELSRAIRTVGEVSEVTEAQLKLVPGRFQRSFADAVTSVTPEDLGLRNEEGELQEQLFGINNSAFASGIGGPEAFGGGLRDDEIINAITDPASGGFDLVGLEDRVRAQLSEKGKLTSGALNRIIGEEMASFNITELGGVELTEDGQTQLKEMMDAFLRGRMEEFVSAYDPNKIYNRFELKRLLDEVVLPGQEAGVASLTEQGYGEGSDRQIQQARANLRQLQSIPTTRNPGSRYYDELRIAEGNLARNLLARSAAMREVAQDQAKSDAQVRRIGQRAFRQDARIAARSGNEELIKQVIASGNRQQINIMRDMIRNQIEFTKTKLLADGLVGAAAEQAIALNDATGKALLASQAKVQATIARLRESLGAINRLAKTTLTTNQYNSPDSLDAEADSAPTETAQQISAAAQAAEAARTDDAVAQARAGVAAAAADLAAAEPGTVEYYSALQAYYEAQRALSDTILETSAAAKLAEAARTDDALAQARANLSIAAAQLASETPGTLAYYQALQAYREAQLALDDTIVEQQNARILARASARGSAVVTATAELEAARNSLQNETEGTLAYYQALQAFNEAKRALSDAIREDKYVRDQLAGDVTDPVDQARAELRRARRQLRYDQRVNAGPDQVASSRLEVRQQEAALQAAKFDQWLGDLQTNEALDRIGHAQYIRTLERRIQRLRDIRHRTRQEQDQLDQLLQVLQEAQKALSGQFNIGEIRTPTPYEARRYIEERRAQIERELGGAGGSSGSPSFSQISAESRPNQTLNHFDIDGADTGLIKRLLIELLGRNAIGTTSTAPGKR